MVCYMVKLATSNRLQMCAKIMEASKPHQVDLQFEISTREFEIYFFRKTTRRES